MMTDTRPPCRKCGSTEQLWVAEAQIEGLIWNKWVCRRCCYGGLYAEHGGENAPDDLDEQAERHIEYHGGCS